MDKTNAVSTGDWLRVVQNMKMQIFGYTPILISSDRGDLTEGLSTIDSLYRDLTRFFVERMTPIGLVERVYMSYFDREIDIWTILSEDTEEIRKRLYEIEAEILSRFQEFVFDFHIYALSDITLDEFEKDSNILRIYPH